MQVLVVGAGVAGLTLAYKLAEKGNAVTVVELEPVVGGLARSFRYGDWFFDLGPHRFHTDIPDVEAFIRQIMGENLVTIGRSSGVWFFDRYHEWPLQTKSIFQIPFKQMVSAFIDIFTRPRAKGDNFEEWVIARYGRTIYRLFFQPYTEKFLKYPCAELHRDWAKAGINRAVIEKKLETKGLIDLIWKTLLPEKADTQFLYPRDGGIGAFPVELAKRIQELGGTILTGNRIVKLVPGAGDRIAEAHDALGNVHRPDVVIWTAPIPEVSRLLALPDPGLEYLSSIFYNFEINEEHRLPYQWIYFGGKQLIFNRASFPGHFSRRCAPTGKQGICIELACMEGDAWWKDPERESSVIREHMVSVGLVKRYNAILDMHIEPVRNTYPIYTMGYRQALQAAEHKIAERAKNLHLLGRTGKFWYNNMDHSIAMAMKLSRALIDKEKSIAISKEEIFNY
jgi:protoporphyrinogen oxidase